MSSDLLKLLPEYTCHKVVRAARILENVTSAAGVDLLLEGLEKSVHFDSSWWRKHQPKNGDILVVYADGYVSVSPQDAFHAGYSIGVNPVPRIVIVMDDGVLQDVLAERPTEVIKIEFDVEDTEASERTQIPKILYHQATEAHARRFNEDVEPELVGKVHALFPKKVT